MAEKKLTIEEKWKFDIETYDNGAKVKTKFPQCEGCLYYVKGDALHCRKYAEDRKPKEVLLAQKECTLFEPTKSLEVHLSDDIEEKLYGGIFGFVIGDLLGVPVEFSSRQERDADPIKELRAYGTYHQPFGSWSDDSSFTLCLMDAMIKDNIVVELKNNMIDCYKKGLFTPRGQLFDIGISTGNAINNMMRGINPIECGGVEENDNGNGSLMRVLPLAFVRDRYGSQEYVRLIEDVSSVTHGHNRSKLACVIYVLFASNLYRGMEKEEALDSAIRIVVDEQRERYKSELEHYKFVCNKKVIGLDRMQIKSTGYVVDTLEAAVWSFFNSKSYKEVVLNAVNLGGDTDTIAAVAGGLAGIYYGFKGVPNLWIQNVIEKEKIADLCDKLFERYNK